MFRVLFRVALAPGSFRPASWPCAGRSGYDDPPSVLSRSVRWVIPFQFPAEVRKPLMGVPTLPVSLHSETGSWLWVDSLVLSASLWCSQVSRPRSCWIAFACGPFGEGCGQSLSIGGCCTGAVLDRVLGVCYRVAFPAVEPGGQQGEMVSQPQRVAAALRYVP